jgi:PDZ domain-containing secreted protein
LSEELAAQLPVDAGSGLLVRTVLPDSPAAQAGIQKNDVLIKLDDQTLSAPKQLQKLVASRKPGDTVKIIYLRRGQRAEVDAKLAEHEQPANTLYLSRDPNAKGENTQNFQLWLDGRDARRVPFDPLSLQKKIVIVDKHGNVVAKDDAEAQQAEAIKRMAAEVDRMKDQAAAAQKQAQEAIRHAENAAREAAEVAKKEAAAIAERMRDAVRQLQEQLEKQQPQKREQ